jgi:hypothetical protein
MAVQAARHAKHHRLTCRRKEITAEVVGNSGSAPGGSDQLRQQHARPDIAPVDPGQEPSLIVTCGSSGNNGRNTCTL